MWIIDHIKWFELFYYTFAILTFMVAFYTFNVYRQQLYGAIISRCIDIYRKDFFDLSSSSNEKKCLDYIDFVNEELFYYQNSYISKKVANEWVDGMIEFLPIHYKDKIVNESNCLHQIKKLHLLQKYPRVMKSFTICKVYNYEEIYSKNPKSSIAKLAERKKLINEILSNIKKYKN
jgi:hypothetical protein